MDIFAQHAKEQYGISNPLTRESLKAFPHIKIKPRTASKLLGQSPNTVMEGKLSPEAFKTGAVATSLGRIANAAFTGIDPFDGAFVVAYPIKMPGEVAYTVPDVGWLTSMARKVATHQFHHHSGAKDSLCLLSLRILPEKTEDAEYRPGAGWHAHINHDADIYNQLGCPEISKIVRTLDLSKLANEYFAASQNPTLIQTALPENQFTLHDDNGAIMTSDTPAHRQAKAGEVILATNPVFHTHPEIARPAQTKRAFAIMQHFYK